MGIVVDTCIFILAERSGILPDLTHLNDDIYISTVTMSELLIGLHRANTPERKLKRSTFIDAILAEIPTLDFIPKAAHLHAEICAVLAQQGCTIGAYDSLIAATALAHNYALLTYNYDEFSRVPGLKLVK